MPHEPEAGRRTPVGEQAPAGPDEDRRDDDRISSTTPAAGRRLTITEQFDAPVERVWQLWAGPRLLEQWWGPPTHPITVLAHDLRPGGKVSYVAVGPNGEQIPGSWDVREVDPPHHLVFDLGNVATSAVGDDGPDLVGILRLIAVGSARRARTRRGCPR